MTKDAARHGHRDSRVRVLHDGGSGIGRGFGCGKQAANRSFRELREFGSCAGEDILGHNVTGFGGGQYHGKERSEVGGRSGIRSANEIVERGDVPGFHQSVEPRRISVYC
jgi:hypothetical protein